MIDPALIGRYEIIASGQPKVDAQRGAKPDDGAEPEDHPETMGTLVDPRELDLRPRAAVAALNRARQAGTAPRIDVSWAVALCVLGLMVAELVLRVVFGRRTELAAAEAEGAA